MKIPIAYMKALLDLTPHVLIQGEAKIGYKYKYIHIPTLNSEFNFRRCTFILYMVRMLKIATWISFKSSVNPQANVCTMICCSPKRYDNLNYF